MALLCAGRLTAQNGGFRPGQEVAQLDVAKQSPAFNGTILCLSCYAGPGVAFEEGKCRLWVDCYDAETGGVPAGQAPIPPVLAAFRDYFEDEGVRKVWHNFSFDAHILMNYGIRPYGLGGDTMHMARLWDSSLGHDFEAGAKSEAADAVRGYSLTALSRRLLDRRDSWKTGMKALFGVPKLRKDGSPSKAVTLPPLEVCHYMTQPLVELYEDCMVVLKVSWYGIMYYGRSRTSTAPRTPRSSPTVRARPGRLSALSVP
jgi:hypothetical protein